MRLETIIRLVEVYVRQESKRRNLRFSEDVVQESLLAAWLRIRDGEELGRGAIRSIVRNKIVDEIRRDLGRYGSRPRVVHITIGDWQSLEERPQEQERRSYGQRRDEALRGVPPEYREIAILELQGYTFAEIAKRMGISKSEVHRRIELRDRFLRRADDD
jgi:RNA polymerase sigma factor (sigma-70 family)